MTTIIEGNKSFKSGKQFAWDATSLSLAQTCLRKYQYKMLEGWQPRGLSVHLRFGQHYATALEHYYKHIALGLSKQEALVLVVREALEDTWDRTEDNLDGAPWESNDANKTRETLIRTIVWYADYFEDDTTPVIILADGKPAVEYSFTLPVDDDIVFSGHIDRLVEYADHPYVMDQKTTKSTISAYYMDQFKPNTQMSMYTFAGRAIWNIPVKGVIIDAAQIAVGFSRFERGFTTRTEGELNEWYDNSMYWIARAQEASINDYFPMNPAACGNYGGCEFRKVCGRDPQFRKQFLQADFDQGPSWDPLTRR